MVWHEHSLGRDPPIRSTTKQMSSVSWAEVGMKKKGSLSCLGKSGPHSSEVENGDSPLNSSNDLQWEKEGSEQQTEAKVHTVFIIEHSFLYNYISVHFLFLVLEHSHSDEIKERAGRRRCSYAASRFYGNPGHLIHLPR